ncbi:MULTISPECIES: cellulose biosynthesis protein BcsN [Alphaproteobacteria]|uniref:Cellulose biosynthesis protein BcsN n=2 Tax=Alphaproteobacteria TaxID=28211 RepID=A0A512HNK1_9HYPH|nr:MULTISPECIES: cellulose biosynthesis protein BcsN [Alphaproteobacteria]GEO87009.1 hypothetical protein RNA01_39410 [Ciceribacter naphthalenivorans]
MRNTAAEQVARTSALVFPPPGGPAIVGVIENNYANGTEQIIALHTTSSVNGQNAIKVQFVGTSSGSPSNGRLLSPALKPETTILREMRRDLPGIAMRRSPLYLQNNYGPFAYASGTSNNGDVCIYGWQQIRSNGEARSALSNLGLIQIRLRLCDSLANEQQLLETMYGLTIVGAFSGKSWNPYGPAARANQTVGALDHPIYPVSAEARVPAPQPVRKPADVPKSDSPQPPPVRKNPDQRPTESQPQSGPLVPLPPMVYGTQSALPVVPLPN